MLAGVGPDIVGLQETKPIAGERWRTAFEDSRKWGKGRDSGPGQGCATENEKPILKAAAKARKEETVCASLAVGGGGGW